jgi:hypothetical protein
MKNKLYLHWLLFRLGFKNVALGYSTWRTLIKTESLQWEKQDFFTALNKDIKSKVSKKKEINKSIRYCKFLLVYGLSRLEFVFY